MILFRQAARTLWRQKKSYLACIVLMSAGIAMFVSFHLLFENLGAAMDGMYSAQRFGDGFASVASMPLSGADRAASIDGIRQLDATLVTDARMQKDGSTKIITLRISSYDPGQEDRLNDFILVKGGLPGDDGIVVGEVFAEANNLSVGDPISLIIEGKEYTPTVTGMVQSPEYVYAIPDTGQLMPDNEAFGFGYMPLDRLGTITGRTGAANTISFLLEDGVAFNEVKHQLEESLSPYGLISITERKNQPSHAMLDQEVESIGTMATSLPSMFVLLSTVILYIMLKRMIEQERMQIGTLKAFGFTDRTILLHYLCYGAITGLVGGLVGVVLGIVMTDSLTLVYLEFFSLPAMRVPPNPVYLVEGMALALGAGVLGSFMGTRAMLRLSPSEAMRPPAPPAVKGDILGRIPLLRHLLSSYGYMATRNITRNKFRSAFVVVGVAFAFALTAFMSSFSDMFDSLMFNQFTKVELYNMKLSLKQPTGYQAALEDAFSLEGVRHAEGMMEIPVEVRKEHLKKNLSLTAIQPDARLYQIYDNDGDFVTPPPSGGVIVSSALADDLMLRRGDLLTMRTPYTGDTDIPLPVLGSVASNLGSTVYITMPHLWELLEITPTVTSVLVDTDDPDLLKELLVDAENISALTDQEDAKQIYTDLLETYVVLIYMMQLIGVVIAFAIITNTASISLSERKREYATMRVLGMLPREIGQVVGFEYWILTLVAIPPGILLTRILKEAMSGVVGNEVFSLPVRTEPSSYLSAAVLVLLTVAVSNLFARRKIAGFDMVEVLKERE